MKYQDQTDEDSEEFLQVLNMQLFYHMKNSDNTFFLAVDLMDRFFKCSSRRIKKVGVLVNLTKFEVSKIRAAKELVEKSIKLGNSIEQYLGKEQEDSFENLVDYVGADGKYISITKSVKIYYPKEYLKGVESPWDEEVSSAFLTTKIISLTEFYQKLNLPYNKNLNIYIIGILLWIN